MRTTLVIDPQLYREARKRAAERDTTLSELVNEGLKLLLGAPPRRKAKVRFVVVGDPKKPIDVTPERVRAALAGDGGL